MAVTKKDVEHVAWLARLALSEEEKAKYAKQLSGILEHMAKIAAVDTTAVAPTSHVLPLRNVMRTDEPTPCLTQAEAIKNAPKKEDSAFVVPKIV